MTTPSSLSDAVALHQSGQLDAAARIYREILTVDPKNPDALHLLGAVYLQQENPAKAADLIRQAVALAPKNPAMHGNLATALLEQGKIDEAIGHYETALSIDPNYLDARYNLGNARRQKGDFAGAAADYARVAEMEPRHLPARNSHALCLLELDQFKRAVEILEDILRQAPDDRQTRQNLGIALQVSGRPNDAVDQFDRILANIPTDIAALNGRAAALITALRLEEAETAAAASRHAPDDYETMINRGNLFQYQKKFDQAEAVYRQTIDRFPNSAGAWQNLAQLLSADNRHAESLAAYDQALELDPGHRRAAFGRAVSALSIGKFSDGWRGYRQRPNILAQRHRLMCDPLPPDLSGQHFIVERDQGLGDEIFFLRFLGTLRARGARVSYLPDQRLAAMIDRAEIADQVIGAGETVTRSDHTIAVSDLPYVLGMCDEDLPPPSISLPALPDRVEAIRNQLRQFGPAPYLGLTWRAGTKGLYGSIFKDAPLDAFATALRGIAGTIIALQRQPEAGEIGHLSQLLDKPVHDLTRLNTDLEAMLALVGQLDEYICVSNTNVHLRAAQGRPCHVLVPHPAEFRWMAHGRESPWFPGSPVYRQAADGDWSAALSDLASAFRS